MFRINADLSLFKDLYVGDNRLDKDVHYTATSGSTVLTFTDEGMHYLESLGPGLYEIRAGFTDTDNISLATLTLEEVGKHILTIHYKYPKLLCNLYFFVIIQLFDFLRSSLNFLLLLNLYVYQILIMHH